MNFELSLGMVQSKRSNVFSGSQFGWFGCVKTECSRSWLDDGCQRLGRSNDFSTNINWKDFSRSCLLIKESFVGVPLNDVMMTSSWHNITWMYVGERNNSIGALVIYFIDSSDPIETCKNFYSVLGSILLSDLSANENIGGLCRTPFQIRHFRLTWRSTFSFFYILD